MQCMTSDCLTTDLCRSVEQRTASTFESRLRWMMRTSFALSGGGGLAHAHLGSLTHAEEFFF